MSTSQQLAEISREFRRNTQLMRTQWGCWQYKTHYAQTYADERHKNKPKHIKLTKAVEKFVDEKFSSNGVLSKLVVMQNVTICFQ